MGTPGYGSSANTWIRGLLRDEYGIKHDEVRWIETKKSSDQGPVTGGGGFSAFEGKAYIQDHWKLLRLPEPFGSGLWQLFDVADDPGESVGVSGAQPEVKAALIEAWQEYSDRNEVYDHKGRLDEMYRRAYMSH